MAFGVGGGGQLGDECAGRKVIEGDDNTITRRQKIRAK